MKISINELFSGIGAQHKALLNLGYDVEVVGISEIDKYAIQSYEAIYGKTRNYGDISKVERLDYADMWTYSFPCTDISVAGKQEGINENTRSGLLYQVQRLLDVAKDEGMLPKYLLLENVKNLVGKKFKSQFDNWLFYLESLGYVNYWQVLNAKDYGIPQNRERVFVVSIRADIPKLYQFPQKEELKLRLKDMLEDNVDEKFYISDEKINKILNSNFAQERTRIQQGDICQTLLARDFKDPKCIQVKEATKQGYATATIGDSINIEQPNSKTRRGRVGKGVAQTLTTSPQQCVIDKVMQVGNIVNTGNWDNPQRGHIYSADGISPTLNCMQGGGLEPKIIEPNKSFVEKKYKKFYDSKGYIPELFNPYNCKEITELAPTQTTFCGSLTSSATVLKSENLRIRKLTPKECWRLMGFDDEDFDKTQASGVSNSQLYKQAGNSIVVDVLEKIFKNLE